MRLFLKHSFEFTESDYIDVKIIITNNKINNIIKIKK